MVKKLIFLPLIALSIAIASCSSDAPKTELQTKCESLMEMYPNYESNNVARATLNDSVVVYCESFVGKEATLLKGIEFDYVKIFENHDNGSHAALFKGRVFCEIDAKGGKTKYIISSPLIQVLGTIPEDMVATLDQNQSYTISGTVHAWDGENMLGEHSVMTPADISFGTFILDTMTVTQIEK